MVWGAIGIGFRSSLIIFDWSVNAETYLEELKKNFIKEASDVYGSSQWVMVQEGATCHTTLHNINELTKRCLVCPSWPPNSPDLNPIEMLWAIIKGRIRWTEIHNREEAIEGRNVRDQWSLLLF
jgi:hypothetical protein